MRDTGAMDEKILAIPFGDPVNNSYRDVSDLPAHVAEEISHFFNVYKNLEKDKSTEIVGVFGRDEAIEVLKRCYDRYIDKFCRG